MVDDDAAIREFLSEILEQQDFEVQTATDGLSGLAACETEPFDLLLVDFQMPGMTGVEMTAEVSYKPGSPDVSQPTKQRLT